MKVHELIKELQKADKDLEVVLLHQNCICWNPLIDVKSLKIEVDAFGVFQAVVELSFDQKVCVSKMKNEHTLLHSVF